MEAEAVQLNEMHILAFLIQHTNKCHHFSTCQAATLVSEYLL